MKIITQSPQNSRFNQSIIKKYKEGKVSLRQLQKLYKPVEAVRN